MDVGALTVKTVRDGPVCTLILRGDLDLPATGRFLEQAARLIRNSDISNAAAFFGVPATTLERWYYDYVERQQATQAVEIEASRLGGDGADEPDRGERFQAVRLLLSARTRFRRAPVCAERPVVRPDLRGHLGEAGGRSPKQRARPDDLDRGPDAGRADQRLQALDVRRERLRRSPLDELALEVLHEDLL